MKEYVTTRKDKKKESRSTIFYMLYSTCIILHFNMYLIWILIVTIKLFFYNKKIIIKKITYNKLLFFNHSITLICIWHVYTYYYVYLKENFNFLE